MVYTDNGGKIIFSQVCIMLLASHSYNEESFLFLFLTIFLFFEKIHLEIDPSFYENDEQKYQILMNNDNLRHEIFGDVLSTHLGLATGDMKVRKREGETQFSKGYFLGRHEVSMNVYYHKFYFLLQNYNRIGSSPSHSLKTTAIFKPHFYS